MLTSIAPGNPEKPNVRFSTELKGHASAIEKVAFNPVKDAELASLSNDGIVKIWDVRTKNCVNEVKGLGNANAMVWSPDGASLLAGNRVSSPLRLLIVNDDGELISVEWRTLPTVTDAVDACFISLAAYREYPDGFLLERAKDISAYKGRENPNTVLS